MKNFDNLMILDTGGFPIYYGNPVESVIYFKKAINHVSANESECHHCGNVNPEQIFNIIETKVVDESFPVEPFKKLGYSVEVYGQKSYNGVAIITKHRAENVKKGFYDCIDFEGNIEIFQNQKRLMLKSTLLD